MAKRIRATVSPLGKIKIEVEGYAGEACLAVLKQITDRLGKAATLTPTAEYYEATTDTRVYEYE